MSVLVCVDGRGRFWSMKGTGVCARCDSTANGWISLINDNIKTAPIGP